MSFETEVNLMMALSDAMADGVEKAGASTVLVNARPRIPSSGLAVAADLVLTSNHAVEQTQGIRVLLPDGSWVQASLVGRDNPTDLALLRLEKPRAIPAERAPGEPRVGQLVLAVARPGEEGLQASQGVISFVGGPFRTQSGILLQRFLRS
ncbi:MAG TPA: trypsin-like peptidase domain-containing protein, partial [Anaerolineaceae bacterium]|nr:trypsin-like peptidase domain-containing protein [Anaerolineaceae bacterium]